MVDLWVVADTRLIGRDLQALDHEAFVTGMGLAPRELGVAQRLEMLEMLEMLEISNKDAGPRAPVICPCLRWVTHCDPS